MQQLKNIIIGFVNEKNLKQFEKNITQTSLPRENWHILSKVEAKREFLDKDNKGTIFEKVNKVVHKHIGGGPSEFLRDIDEMDQAERLFVAHVEDVKEDVKVELKRLLKLCQVRQSKYFGSYAVEHVTLDEAHDQEMPLVN